jgi:16S rRNA (cytidine1402-2'-O)-methyltransferase
MANPLNDKNQSPLRQLAEGFRRGEPNGILYLIPVPLADEAAAKSFTPYLVNTVNHISEYIVENEKTARRFLKEAGLKAPQSELLIHDYGKHQRGRNDYDFFSGLLAGKDVGLMSEAGCPGIADPGADIVAEAHRKGIKVVPLVGPSSILLALMASGFNGQSFAFHGYLPIDKADRSKRIKELEAQAERLKQTQLFIETPFRNNALLEELLRACKPNTRLCIACNLTSAQEMVKTLPIATWKKQTPDLHKQPTIFLLFHP